VEAYGEIDEINSCIGLIVVKISEPDIKEHLMDIQKDLFAVGSNLAFPQDLSQSSIKGQSFADKIPRITDETVLKLERWIDLYETELPPLRHFILAGGNESSSLLHIARTTCRRAERRVVSLRNHEEVNKNVLKYVNRLSDYLFTAARLVSKRAGKDDIEWLPGQ
jgi:cob(I)alamin adenosyltransferase